MSIEQMRAAIREVYDGPWWKNKVDRMHENQVLAIYSRMLETGKLKGTK